MGNYWDKEEILNIHSSTHYNDPENNDNMVKHLNYTKDSLLLITKNGKPICYTLSYDKANDIVNNNYKVQEATLIYPKNEFKIYNVKGVGY